MRRWIAVGLSAVSFAVCTTLGWAASDPELGVDYREPAPAITRLLTAMRPPEYLFSPTSQRVALVYRESVISLERLSRPRLGLGGHRLDPATRTTDLGVRVVRVEVFEIATPGKPVVWTPPAGAELEHVAFSPDGLRLSGVVFERGASRLALFELASARARTLDVALHPAFGDPCVWLDAEGLLCRTVPADLGPPPRPALSPNTIEHSGGRAPTRTYANLLRGVHDEDLFDHWFASELARIDRDGKVRRFAGSAGVLVRVAASPDRELALVTRLERPYSHMLPSRAFPRRLELWNVGAGKRLEAPGLPRQTGVTPTRGRPLPQLRWRTGPAPALGWIEGREGGGSTWRVLDPPTAKASRPLVESRRPIGSFGWTSAGTPYFAVRPGPGEVEYFAVRDGKARALWQGATKDLYGNPGRALRTRGDDGPVLEHGGKVFMASDGLGESGPRPHLDALDLASGESRRMLESPEGEYARALAVLDPDTHSVLAVRESETRPPELYRVAGDGSFTRLVAVPDPYPELDGVERRLVEYQRGDGVHLNGSLYLPAGHDGSRPLPTLVWIYPAEFSDSEYAEQIPERRYRFHHVRGPSPIAVTLAGYALLLNPTMPIIGDPGEATDEYLSQLVANAEAAVGFLTSSGIADPARIAIGGHSYGAFSSTNLLAHTDLFRTGLAFSGAYNRTLTPFGFQHEKRSFWDETEMYTRISPFFAAEKIDEPLLLVHGGGDENPGTPTMQARRLLHALVGLGAQVRYVELPFEGHHYRARQNILHAAAEMIDWLDRTIGPKAPPAKQR